MKIKWSKYTKDRYVLRFILVKSSKIKIYQISPNLNYAYP
jgi:hypothetical protein